MELAAEPVQRDPCILLGVYAPRLVGLRLQRGREELSQASEDDPGDQEHHEQLGECEAVLRFNGSADAQRYAPPRDRYFRRRALGHQAMRRLLSTRSACASR